MPLQRATNKRSNMSILKIGIYSARFHFELFLERIANTEALTASGGITDIEIRTSIRCGLTISFLVKSQRNATISSNKRMTAMGHKQTFSDILA